MDTKGLEKHVIDTIKEWQIKIGYMPGSMKLYYPAESLADLLGLTEGEDLDAALLQFAEAVLPYMGRVSMSHEEETREGESHSGDRYCLDISAKGCAYVAEEAEEPEFLKRFLRVVTAPRADMGQVRACFAGFAKEKGVAWAEAEGVDEDGGRVFYFKDYPADPYVYCVECNEFGVTYHRFTRREYKRLI